MKASDARIDKWRDALAGRREVAVFGPITEESAHDAILQLKELDANANDQRPITVLIDSYGGEIYGASAVNAAIMECKHDVHTVAYGKAMSAGFSIFMRGKKRTVHADTSLLAHTASIGFGRERVKTPDLEDDVARVKAWLEREAEFYARQCFFVESRTKADKDFWRKIVQGKDDVVFWPKEAVELGIAHDVIGV